MSLELKWISLCLALVAGEALGFGADRFALAWPVVSAAAAVVLLVGYGLSLRFWPFAFAFVAGAALALFASASRMEVLDEIQVLNGGRPCRGVFEIGYDVCERKDGRGARHASFAGDLRGIPVRVEMAVCGDAECPRQGETWELVGWLGRRDGLFGGWRRTFWVRGRGSSARRIATDGEPALAAVRRDFSRRVGLGLGHEPEVADLNRAMLLGERSRIAPETRRAFVDAGTVHVFAISGLHVLFVAKIFSTLLALAFVPRRIAGLVLVPLLWTYVALVGSGPSAVRAATMATVCRLSPLFWRRSNGFVAWSIAFVITYVRAPEMVFDVGCGLSFAVMFAIVAWVRWSKGVRLDSACSLGIPAIAWLAGVPMAAHVFGRITPGGLVANLFAVPMAEAGVTAGSLGLMASYFSEPLAVHLNNLSALATGSLAGLSRFVASQGWSSRPVRPWSIPECIAWYVAMVLALLAARAVILRRRRRL